MWSYLNFLAIFIGYATLLILVYCAVMACIYRLVRRNWDEQERWERLRNGKK